MSNYNYGPPPPPPSQAGHQPYGHHSAPYTQSTSGTPARSGGSHPRGRGGGYASSYNAGRPEYQPPSQQPPPYPYSGYAPPTPAAYASDGSYQSQPPWQPEHTPAPPLSSHAPAPLSSSNYHPNFAQPGYGQQQHPQQPQPPQQQQPQQQQYAGHPSYATPSQSPYPPHYASAPPAASPQWSAPPAHQAQPNGYQGGGRHRGGYQSDRGGSRGSPAMRVGYREEHHQPPATPGYGASPYPDPRAPTPYQTHQAPQQYHYAPPPAAPPVAGPPASLPTRHDGHFAHGHGNSGRRGGRGGSFRDGNNRGRSQFQGSGDKQRHHKKSNNAQHEPNNQKSEQQQAHGKKKKRKVHNTLGLTPGDDGSGSDEDDEGEEGKLSDLMGSEVIQISDMAAFIAERKKRYPTKDRVAAKQKAEVAQKAQKTAETLRLEQEADKLRRQLKKVESSIKRKREQQDEGDEMREASPVADSDADMPEVQSSRAPGDAATPSSEAAKKADISRHCKYYSTGGSCGKKGKCRFVHDSAVREAAIREKEANNGQLTIKQRLILNDKEQEDLTVLESIQYLREKGLMKPVSGITIKPGGGPGRPQSRTSKQSAAPAPSTLPAPPPSLPLPLNKRENGLPRTTPSSGAAATLPPAASSPATSTASAAPAAADQNLGGYGGAGIKEEDLP